MAKITLGGNPVETSGNLPKIGSKLADFKLVTTDLETKTLSDFEGQNLIFNIFPSVNTGICSASVRAFNTSASDFENTKKRVLDLAKHKALLCFQNRMPMC